VVGTGSLTPALIDATIPHENLSLAGAAACTMHNVSKAWYCIGRIGAESFSSPQLVSFSGSNVVQAVTVGASSVCGIATDGRGYCFGSHFSGSLNSPIGPLANVSKWRHFENGLSAHFCGIDADNNGYCWGMNNTGQVGDGTAINRSAPTKISGSWSQLIPAMGAQGGNTGDHTCGLSTAGSVYCWGFGEGYQLGNGSATSIVLRPEKKVKNLP
jgi:alpha-tubulin suppressor-like RCC1 family protein